MFAKSASVVGSVNHFTCCVSDMDIEISQRCQKEGFRGDRICHLKENFPMLEKNPKFDLHIQKENVSSLSNTPDTISNATQKKTQP